jgi:hypothetical protein
MQYKFKLMTSIEWLQDKWGNEKIWTWEKIQEWFEQAKEMHKNEILDAYSSGRFDYEDYSKGIKEKVKQSEEYYKQVYKQE